MQLTYVYEVIDNRTGVTVGHYSTVKAAMKGIQDCMQQRADELDAYDWNRNTFQVDYEISRYELMHD